jgi:hypothetical protein
MHIDGFPWISHENHPEMGVSPFQENSIYNCRVCFLKIIHMSRKKDVRLGCFDRLSTVQMG